MTNMTSTQLRRAANLKDKIEKLQGDLNRMLGGAIIGNGSPAKKTRRKMSAASRAKIAAAARARWAKVRAAKK